MTNEELRVRYNEISIEASSKAVNLIFEGYKFLAREGKVFAIKVFDPSQEPDLKMKQQLSVLTGWRLSTGLSAIEYMAEVKKVLTLLEEIILTADELKKRATVEAEKEDREKALEKAIANMFDAGDELPDFLKGKEEEIRQYLDKTISSK